ncbi:hypothetical protein HanXRQr2_Chr04g0185371 [Helianthus annuus]|uniref:Uncharacterized protein n=1 Tax=Helianthus annuus TaxID=4232 RepID=A0A9K3NT86_HELAN|nr:hypothetical protein HanXRQr2_Chr04g0185371 [Helianthus annuus]KAJ0932894.1 hypothetical protein HanPSC8_Chr04g0178921 [Helianthus annuus]
MSAPPAAGLTAPARMVGGTYAPPLLGPEAPASAGLGFGFSTKVSLGWARSLYGHLEVQWSPFLPHVLHTIRTAPPFDICASGSPDAFDSSAFEPVH